MDLHDRIDRRRVAHRHRSVVVDRGRLSPVVHLPQPIGRGPVLERLLDALEPVFDGTLPPNLAVAGPPGSGTSAVVTALFSALSDRLGEPTDAIGTTTRAGSADPSAWFVYVDARRATSSFAFYRALLSDLSAEPVPSSGVGTDDLRARLCEHLDRGHRAIVAVDHHDEPETLSIDRVRTLLEPVDRRVSIVAVGQRVPDGWDDPMVAVPAYRQHELVDVVTERASAGLTAGALDHRSIRDLAAWADGSAHAALAALFGAAVLAGECDSDRIESSHLERAKDAIPADSVHVDRPLALSSTRQRVLCELLSSAADPLPISEAAVAIADDSSLSAGTVKRFLYELAECDVLVRTPLAADGRGRRPSALEARFPTIAFCALATECGNCRK